MHDLKAHHAMAIDTEARWLEHFGLRRRPFVAVPHPEYYCPVEPMESARHNLLRMIRRGEGVGLIAGPPGTGKTLLCQLLARELGHEFAVVFLAGGRIDTPKALFQAILFQLGLSFYGLDEGELRIALEAYLAARELPEFLTRGSRAVLPPRPVVLLVDESHGLPLRILEEIRTLTNVFTDEVPRAHVVLAGGMLLEDRLSSPRLEALAQRIVVRAYLQAFTRPQTEAFVRHQIALAGGDPERIFPADAVDALYRATGGIPRLVIQVADHAMFLAFAAGRPSLNWQLVEEAWADLQQLPGPWNDSQRRDRPNTIEFGLLVDEDRAAEENSAGCTVPFLRVARPDGPGDATMLETLERVERAVANLVAECHPEAPHAAEEASQQSDGEVSTDTCGQSVIAVDGNGYAIEIDLPPIPNPFDEAFDAELPVNSWHVDYICQQPRRAAAEILVGGQCGRFGRRSLAEQLWQEIVAEDSDAFVAAPLAAGWGSWQWESLLMETVPWRNGALQPAGTHAEGARAICLTAANTEKLGGTQDCFGAGSLPAKRDETPCFVSELLAGQPHSAPIAQHFVYGAQPVSAGSYPGDQPGGQHKPADNSPIFQLPWCENAEEEPSPPRMTVSVRRVRREKHSLGWSQPLSRA